ncbi:alcohol dehydrogenase catalytic domain-containing protein, partial [Streptomyces sp. NPDC052015]
MSGAVVIEAPGEYRIVAHEPTAPAAGEALVRVHASGICGSDREVYQGN